MKHRSVIAFVIVAAALFSLPQLSYDLQALKGAVGARLHRELLHAFLNLPAGDPVVAAPVARPAEMLFASCSQQERAGAPAAKPFKAGRVAERGQTEEQTAMIGDPRHDPVSQMARVEIKEAADAVVVALRDVKVETEVAMIVPPEQGIDARGFASAHGANGAARVTAERLRVGAENLRVAYTTAARLQGHDAEWQKATGDVFRQLKESLPGVYEVRIMRDGAKTKVLKRCNECPVTAPRLPRAPRPMPTAAPLPAQPTLLEWASE